MIVVALLTVGLGWREALIVAIAVPVVFGLTLAANLMLGFTINRVTLFALILSLGLLVDDPIVDVENIARRIRLNREAGNPKFAFRVELDASLEVRSAVVYASLIVILVFLPVFFLDGLAGAFFRPLSLAYVLAILASLLAALTLTPALSVVITRTW